MSFVFGQFHHPRQRSPQKNSHHRLKQYRPFKSRNAAMIDTVGILYPGEMGASLARVLQESGCHTVTTTLGRSERTCELCRQSNIRVLPTLESVICESQMIISLVPPSSAWDVAVACQQRMTHEDAARWFVDANSISPLTARRISKLFESSCIHYVDASIHGLASQLKELGTLFVSGPDAKEIAPCFAALARVVILPGEVGQASMFKMLLGGMSKGIVALFSELALAGHRAGLLEELLFQYRFYYPGLMDALDRLLPTYPRNAPRRTAELDELADTLATLGLPPGMLGGARETIARIAALSLQKRYPVREAKSWTSESVVQAICQHGEPASDTRDPLAYVAAETVC
jgi:3-hydroxyisobutyrate dehydrogenase-like beta-hydroxyacid dehydrogenase